MLEAIKLVGGIAGLLTTAFVIWDRLARGRPLAWVMAKKFGANSYKYIRIQNPGPADVFILGVRAHPPKSYGIARDDTERAIAEALNNIDVNVLLSKDEVRDLPIWECPKPVPKDPDKAAEVDQRVRFVIYWRKTSSSWLWQAPVRVFTSTHDIKRIAAAVAAQREP